MASDLKKNLTRLSKRGPHRVLVGDLDYAGLPGKVYTPAEGNALPAVAFGHDWMTSVDKYHATLRHLASWGIVVAAPNTETGINPNHAGFAQDLTSALQIVTGVKLGEGKATVSPGKIGVVGHGMGGGAAVLSAAGRNKIKACVALYPAATTPSEEAAASAVSCPGLILGAGEDTLVDSGNPAAVAEAWKGEVCYREIDKATQFGFSEALGAKLVLGLGLPQYGAIEIARGLMTGFLLATLEGERKYKAFTDPEAEAKKVTSLTGEQLHERATRYRA
ncbi:dienelactone hydrolase family protein [Corynebacterium aquilae]|uniref:Alpha/beta hydrolase n=1 Tax=Corynebacterium aquilae DSM 44791 TaxID=1431546 RepID=A0A1L7CE10_9CORY|nr:dienelactone hydrolase family protein [Corynebacterium aquilae]APT84081.1 alpha/beta hydrolase [Corynebacterium aquilae DSM 44791]